MKFETAQSTWDRNREVGLQYLLRMPGRVLKLRAMSLAPARVQTSPQSVPTSARTDVYAYRIQFRIVSGLKYYRILTSWGELVEQNYVPQDDGPE